MDNSKSIKKIIGENIVSLREKNGLSQEDIVNYLKNKNIKDYQQSSYTAIEKGNRGANPAVLYELSKLFGVSMETFFERPKLQLSEPSQNDKKLAKLKILYNSLDADELDCLISILDSVKKLIDLKITKQNESLDINSLNTDDILFPGYY